MSDEWESLSAPPPSQAITAVNRQAAETATTTPLELKASRQQRLHEIHALLESRRKIKAALVDHPMKLMYSHFLVHFAQQVWRLDLKLRLALLCALLSLLSHAVLLSTAWLWCARPLIGVLLLLAPLLYLYPESVEIACRHLVEFVTTPTALAAALSQINPKQLRRLFLLLMFVPTLLEMRTFLFLCQIIADSTIYSCGALAALVVVMHHSYQQKCSPRECSFQGLVALFGIAWLKTLMCFRVSRLSILSAPFFTAVGVLLYSSHDDAEWFSRTIRHSLRLTLRDVLSTVSESVQQDELLQLAMLRWIVDYWSATTSAEETVSSPNTLSTQRTAAQSPTNDIAWSELLPMLSITADQMETEVEMLQERLPLSTVALAASSDATARPPPSARHHHTLSAFESLKSMLTSMDLDEHAKPAVLAYKRSVETFPPSRIAAILFSTARRCPALLVLLCQVFGCISSTFAASLLLLPFVIAELLRTKQWSDSCKQTITQSSQQLGGVDCNKHFLERVDPMVILLSGDQLVMSQQPSLLVVWMNVCGSVKALETGLTAARCVQTTVVAVDFASNILSLVNFGIMCVDRGWLHGLSVLVREVVALHMNSSLSPSTSPHIRAAFSAVNNSQKMSRNIQILAAEKDNIMSDPIVAFLAVIVGKGWLWGHESNNQERQLVSTVEIEELDGSVCTPVYREPPSSALIAAETSPRDEQGASDVFGLKLRDSCEVKSHQSDDANMVTSYQFVERMSKVMELVALCAEANLINESEKNSLCERLVSSKEENETDMAWIDAICVSLEGLILHAESCNRDELISQVNITLPTAIGRDTTLSNLSTGASGSKLDCLEQNMEEAPHAGTTRMAELDSENLVLIPCSSVIDRDHYESVHSETFRAHCMKGKEPRLASPLCVDPVDSTRFLAAEFDDNDSFEQIDRSLTIPLAASLGSGVSLSKEAAIATNEEMVEQVKDTPGTTVTVERDSAMDKVHGTIGHELHLPEDSGTCLMVDNHPPFLLDSGPPTTDCPTNLAASLRFLAADLDDSDDFEPIGSDSVMEKNPFATSTNSSGATNPHDAGDHETLLNASETIVKSHKSNDEDNNSVWLQIGGGLAVLGAVVGGAAAIAMMQNDNGCKDKPKAESSDKRLSQ